MEEISVSVFQMMNMRLKNKCQGTCSGSGSRVRTGTYLMLKKTAYHLLSLPLSNGKDDLLDCHAFCLPRPGLCQLQKFILSCLVLPWLHCLPGMSRARLFHKKLTRSSATRKLTSDSFSLFSLSGQLFISGQNKTAKGRSCSWKSSSGYHKPPNTHPEERLPLAVRSPLAKYDLDFVDSPFF